jgi:hypothetical protein
MLKEVIVFLRYHFNVCNKNIYGHNDTVFKICLEIMTEKLSKNANERKLLRLSDEWDMVIC